MALSVLFVWVVTYSRSDHLVWSRQSVGLISEDFVSLELRSGRGRLAFVRLHRRPTGPSGFAEVRASEHGPLRFEHHPLHPADPLPRHNLLGFAAGFGVADAPPPGTACDDFYVAVPFWFLLLLASVTPARYLRVMVRKANRERPGHCPACGYDLRATPDRCPECGHPMDDADSAPASTR